MVQCKCNCADLLWSVWQLCFWFNRGRFYKNKVFPFFQKNIFQKNQKLLKLITDLDQALNCDENFMMGIHEVGLANQSEYDIFNLEKSYGKWQWNSWIRLRKSVQCKKSIHNVGTRFSNQRLRSKTLLGADAVLPVCMNHTVWVTVSVHLRIANALTFIFFKWTVVNIFWFHRQECLWKRTNGTIFWNVFDLKRAWNNKKYCNVITIFAHIILKIFKVYDVKEVEKGYAKYPLANQKRIDDYWPLLKTLFKKYHK